jgi:Flp pilus assembly protein TadG
MKRERQRGVATVELALGLPVLLLMIFGIVQVAWWMSNYVVLTNAASTGARLLASERGFATPYSDTVSAISSATAALPGGASMAIAVVNSSGTTTCSGSSPDTTCAGALGTQSQPPAAGTMASVSLTYSFKPLVGATLFNISALMPSRLSANASVVVQ